MRILLLLFCYFQTTVFNIQKTISLVFNSRNIYMFYARKKNPCFLYLLKNSAELYFISDLRDLPR